MINIIALTIFAIGLYVCFKMYTDHKEYEKYIKPHQFKNKDNILKVQMGSFGNEYIIKIENKSEHPVDTVLYGLDSIPYITTKTLTSNIITLDKNTLEILDTKNIEFPNRCKRLSPYDIESLKKLDLTISFKIKESSHEYIMCW